MFQNRFIPQRLNVIIIWILVAENDLLNLDFNPNVSRERLIKLKSLMLSHGPPIPQLVRNWYVIWLSTCPLTTKRHLLLLLPREQANKASIIKHISNGRYAWENIRTRESALHEKGVTLIEQRLIPSATFVPNVETASNNDTNNNIRQNALDPHRTDHYLDDRRWPHASYRAAW